jgi:hypothetical protein
MRQKPGRLIDECDITAHFTDGKEPLRRVVDQTLVVPLAR